MNDYSLGMVYGQDLTCCRGRVRFISDSLTHSSGSADPEQCVSCFLGGGGGGGRHRGGKSIKNKKEEKKFDVTGDF